MLESNIVEGRDGFIVLFVCSMWLVFVVEDSRFLDICDGVNAVWIVYFSFFFCGFMFFDVLVGNGFRVIVCIFVLLYFDFLICFL